MWRLAIGLVVACGCGGVVVESGESESAGESAGEDSGTPLQIEPLCLTEPRGADTAGDDECAAKDRLDACGEQGGDSYPSAMCVSYLVTGHEALRCVAVECNDLGCCPGCMAGDLCVLEGRPDADARCVVGCCDDGDPDTIDAEDIFGGCIHD